jgi:cysteine-rich repeat protein
VGWTCEDEPSRCTGCGDGKVQQNEQCDDGNRLEMDGCDPRCNQEPGWICSNGEPTRCTRCGDGGLSGNEGCDDGNTWNDDGCSVNCVVEPGWSCSLTDYSECIRIPPTPRIDGERSAGHEDILFTWSRSATVHQYVYTFDGGEEQWLEGSAEAVRLNAVAGAHIFTLLACNLYGDCSPETSFATTVEYFGAGAFADHDGEIPMTPVGHRFATVCADGCTFATTVAEDRAAWVEAEPVGRDRCHNGQPVWFVGETLPEVDPFVAPYLRHVAPASGALLPDADVVLLVPSHPQLWTWLDAGHIVAVDASGVLGRALTEHVTFIRSAVVRGNDVLAHIDGEMRARKHLGTLVDEARTGSLVLEGGATVGLFADNAAGVLIDTVSTFQSDGVLASKGADGGFALELDDGVLSFVLRTDSEVIAVTSDSCDFAGDIAVDSAYWVVASGGNGQRQRLFINGQCAADQAAVGVLRENSRTLLVGGEPGEGAPARTLDATLRHFIVHAL